MVTREWDHRFTDHHHVRRWRADVNSGMAKTGTVPDAGPPADGFASRISIRASRVVAM
jgi:hypothetical protein